MYTAYAALATMAILPIYFGAFASLKKWKNPKEKKAIKGQINDPDEDEDTTPETVSSGGTILMPILGSLGLYGLHLAFNYLEKAYVNFALVSYVALMGALATTQVGVNTLSPVLKVLGIKLERWHLNLAKKTGDFYSARFTIVHLTVLVVSIMLTAYYVATKNWIASNVLAFSLALASIQALHLDSFRSGMILLGGFVLFDLYWAYGSNLLESISDNFDLPFQVVFPKLFFGLPAGRALQFATLDLGDIVIPGLFVALCLRFDQHRAGTKNPELGRSTAFRKPYFTGCISGYILGLGVYFYLFHTMEVSQPALLFLAPACVLSVLMTGSVRAESPYVFSYISEEGLRIAKARMEALEQWKQSSERAHAAAAARQRYQQQAAAAAAARARQPIREESPAPSSAASSPSVADQPVFTSSGEDQETNLS
ncbi:minor histocompatibility antigen H13 [Entomortierella parvispora]|uniref:Minor histocompatibility antigen H13 n=1 Tax=Entomortierella parvispora TaxID=205924 RepID=A0A9P3HHK2_9FUNG|nr:minor histocompatibility antigen H13 [Entomortierella parvispora]